MTDEIKSIEEITDDAEFPYVKVVCRPNGIDLEISPNMSSVMLLGISAQLDILGRMQFGQDIARQQEQASGLAVARSIPQDFRKKRRN